MVECHKNIAVKVVERLNVLNFPKDIDLHEKVLKKFGTEWNQFSLKKECALEEQGEEFLK